MPPKKSSPDSKKGSKKGSPGSKKGSPKGEKVEEVVEEVVVRPESPPKVAPRGPGTMYVKRQLWYPHANDPDLILKEYSWTPCCPLITSWGELWVSDSPHRKIWRYRLEPCLGPRPPSLPSIITRGEPSVLVETPSTGRVLAFLRCPSLHKTSLVQYSPEGEVEHVRDYLWEVTLDPPEHTVSVSIPLDEGSPMGLTVDNDTIFVLRSPLQRMELLRSKDLAPVDFRLQGSSKLEASCVHLATAGGCAAGWGLLYVACTRPARVFVFQVIKEMCYRIVDRVTVRALFEFGMDRMKQPFCLRLDCLQVLAVSDSQWGFLRAYHRGGVETSSFGGWKVDELRLVRPGYFSISKNGIICLVDLHKNTVDFFFDRVVLKWYQDTIFYLDKLAYPRPVVDEELPPIPPTRRPELSYLVKGFDMVRWPLIDPDGIWPRPPKEIIPENVPDDKASPDKKSKKSKDSPPSKGGSKGKGSSKKSKK